MRVTRRAVLACAGALSLSGLVGCGSGVDKAAVERLEWLRGLPDVEAAEMVRPPGYRLIENIRLTLTRDLDEQRIRRLAETVVADFGPHAEGFTELVELDFDHCLARFDPLEPEAELLDLDRALWVRSDARATAMRYGESSRIIVTAPRAAVLQVALDYDDAHGEDRVRRRHRVETESRDLAVEWQRSDRETLDHTAVQQLADLQDSHPGLTGWYDGRRSTAGIHFAAEDVDLDTVRTGLDQLIDIERFRTIDLGWGVARARQELFAEGFGGELRTVLDAVAPIAGVSEVRLNRRQGSPALDVITVRDGEAFAGVLADLPAAWPSDADLRLIRELALEVGEDGPQTFHTHVQAEAGDLDFLRSVADLPGVTEIELSEDFAQAYFDPEVSDADLEVTLGGLAAIPRLRTIELLTRVLHASSFAAAARITDGAFADDRNKNWPIPVADDLVTRMETIWEQARG